MPYAEILTGLENLLAPFTVGATRHENRRVDVVVKREHLCAAVRTLVDARWGYLVAITGLDHPWPKTGARNAVAPASPKPGASESGAPAAPKPDAERPAKAGDSTGNPMEDKLEVLYHFAEGPVVATLRVTVPYSDPRVPTICPIVPTATLYERELQELFGVIVEGTPVKDRLVLPDDWPDGVYPLRKSFTGFGGKA